MHLLGRFFSKGFSVTRPSSALSAKRSTGPFSSRALLPPVHHGNPTLSLVEMDAKNDNTCVDTEIICRTYIWTYNVYLPSHHCFARAHLQGCNKVYLYQLIRKKKNTLYTSPSNLESFIKRCNYQGDPPSTETPPTHPFEHLPGTSTPTGGFDCANSMRRSKALRSSQVFGLFDWHDVRRWPLR